MEIFCIDKLSNTALNILMQCGIFGHLYAGPEELILDLYLQVSDTSA